MRTLAIHPGALGDVILFGRLLSRYGHDVTLVAGGEKARLLAGMGVVARGIDFESLPMHEAFGDTPLGQCTLPQILERLTSGQQPEQGFDRLISCFGDGDAGTQLRLVSLCGAEQAAFLPIRPDAEFGGHLLDLWCDLLGEDALPAHGGHNAWPVPAEWLAQAKQTLSAMSLPPHGFCAIHPGAGAIAKCWPLERFAELAVALRRHGKETLFIVGPAEIDRWGAARIEDLQHRFKLLQAPALATLAGVLATAGAFIGNDSGPSHLAAAVGTPTLALFGPTNPTHFAPLGPRVNILAARQMSDIDVDEVLKHVLDAWQEKVGPT